MVGYWPIPFFAWANSVGQEGSILDIVGGRGGTDFSVEIEWLKDVRKR